MHAEGKKKVIRILTRHNQSSNSWTKTLCLAKIVNEAFANEKVGKQSQNTQVLVTILAWQKLKAWSGVWIVQNDIDIVYWNVAAKMNLHMSCYLRTAVSKTIFFIMMALALCNCTETVFILLHSTAPVVSGRDGETRGNWQLRIQIFLSA